MTATTVDRDEEIGLHLSRVGRNLAPELLWYYWAECSVGDDLLRTHLLPVWSAAEWPEQCSRARWFRMFRAAGFVAENDGGDGPLPTRPTETLTVYRGTHPHAPWRRMAWTTNPDIAEWFARREHWLSKARFGAYVPGIVLAAEIRASGVLGISEGRRESEVVVDTRKLTNIRVHASGVFDEKVY